MNTIKARVTIHGYAKSDVSTLAELILHNLPNSVATEIRNNNREPFLNGHHCIIYIDDVPQEVDSLESEKE